MPFPPSRGRPWPAASPRTTGRRNRRNAERRYLETVRARPPDPRRDLEEQFVLHDLISIGNEDQRRLIQLRLQGYTVAEAAQAQGMSGKRARKLLNGLHRVYSDTERGLNIHEY